MIPDFEPDGNLPPGIYPATWAEFVARFGTNSHRTTQIRGLENGIDVLNRHGCSTIYVDGSFVTDTEFPGDFDIAWDPTNVDLAALKTEEPVFFEFDNSRATQKAKFGGEFLPSSAKEATVGKTFLEFFQEDEYTGDPKGIIQLTI